MQMNGRTDRDGDSYCCWEYVGSRQERGGYGEQPQARVNWSRRLSGPSARSE